MLSQPNVDFVFRRGLVLELQQGPEWLRCEAEMGDAILVSIRCWRDSESDILVIM